MKKMGDKNFLLLAIPLALVLGFGVLSLQAWLIGIVLGWFGVTLGFWKCFLIAFLIGCLFGGGARATS